MEQLFHNNITAYRILNEYSCIIEFIKEVGEEIKCESCQAFHHFVAMKLINLIIHEYEC